MSKYYKISYDEKSGFFKDLKIKKPVYSKSKNLTGYIVTGKYILTARTIEDMPISEFSQNLTGSIQQKYVEERINELYHSNTKPKSKLIKTGMSLFDFLVHGVIWFVTITMIRIPFKKYNTIILKSGLHMVGEKQLDECYIPIKDFDKLSTYDKKSIKRELNFIE